MITIFNRQELLITLDANRRDQVRDILSANGIAYTAKVTNLQRGSRGRSGTFGINLDYSYEYKIFVHRNDYEKASWLIR